MINSPSYSLSPLTNSNNDSGRGNGSGMPNVRSPFSADIPELTGPVPNPVDESSMQDVDHPGGGHEGAADEGGEEQADDPIAPAPPAPMERARALPKPVAPTRAQREAHEVCHAKYEPWCEHCVKGRGQNDPHRKLKKAWNQRKGTSDIHGLGIQRA